MFGLSEFAIRLMIRYGALAAFAALAVLTLVAIVMMARSGFRFPGLWSVIAMLSVIGLIMLVSPAWKGVSALGQALTAGGRARPAPSGAFSVGETTLTLAPISTGAPIDVRVWYPADALVNVRRRLILYAPGSGGERDQNDILNADLASHGYVVIGFDDLAFEPAAPNETAEARALREGVFDFSSREALAATIARGDERVAIQSRKARDILDRVAAMADNPEAPWGGNLDVARVGFLGFSFGGATATETAFNDARIAAVANLDGALFGLAATQNAPVPYLLILSDMRQLTPIPRSWRRDVQWILDEREWARAREQARDPRSEVIEVRLARHAALADEYFDSSYARAWLEIDPFRAYDIVQSHVLPFFAANVPVTETVSPPAPARRFDEVLEFGASP